MSSAPRRGPAGDTEPPPAAMEPAPREPEPMEPDAREPDPTGADPTDPTDADPMETVLATRLRVPPVPPTFVRRPRLADPLTDGLPHHPLTLVTGPAGAGKTLLAGDWVRTGRLPGPVAWLTAEARDNLPGAFRSSLVRALHHAGAVRGDQLTGLLGAAPADPDLPVRLAGILAVRPDPLVLVLDACEQLTDPGPAADLHSLSRHAGAGLRLVLLSRTEPLLPLHRYRAADLVTELRAADLAFTCEEAAVLLRHHGLQLSPDGVRALTERTEGWAAGLRLSALAAEHAPDREQYLKEFEAGHSTIADFLLAEVLDTQPADTRDLLLRTSVLERVHPGLADALTGRRDAERILDELAQANAFVTPVGGPWYRHHPLFAEILRVQLRARRPALPGELHARAAGWLHGAGLLDEAVRQAAAAEQWGLAAGWLVEHLAIGSFFTDRGPAAPADVLAALLPATGCAAADAMLAAQALAAHDVTAAAGHLAGAARGPDRAGTDGVAFRCTEAFLHAVAARATGTGGEQAADTLESLGPRLSARRRREHPEFTVLLATALAAVRLRQGRPAAARAALEPVLRTPQEPTRPVPRCEALALLALAELWEGATGRAEEHARRAVEDAGGRGAPGDAGCVLAHLVLADTAAERDDRAAARLSLHRAEAAADGCADLLRAVLLRLTRARLALLHGDPRRALAVLAEQGGPPADPPWAVRRAAALAAEARLRSGDPAAALAGLAAAGVRTTPGAAEQVGAEQAGAAPAGPAAQAGAEQAVPDEPTGRPDRGEAGSAPAGSAPEGAFGEYEAVLAARAHLAAGDPRAALAALPPEACRAPGPAIGVLLVRAELSAAAGHEEAAQRMVARALGLARPDRLCRPFVDAGPWAAAFLRAGPALTAPHRWLPEGLRGPAGPADGPDTPADELPVEPLTVRERDVLERVAELMSTEEVAEDLHLSANTVKTHLKSINRKLRTTRRADAVRQARRLHLL
ncbi:LuxR C-terminal-related transcriptional regulator [Kitasatospora aburaviensis]|uniref:LuxR C-terminal-related transcriptional regulator n=1 Tax=Kitasatospora aburaviensis TaxID=67265 RepID=A0ABW1EXI7_9ACTN